MITFVVSAKVCPPTNETDIESLNFSQFIQGTWIITYKMTTSNILSLFNEVHLHHNIVNLSVTNSSQFELSFECIDLDIDLLQDKMKLFTAVIKKSTNSLIVDNFINELLCLNYKDYSVKYLDIKILSTDFKTHLILYSCHEGTEGFLFLARSLEDNNGILYFKSPRLDIFNGKTFDFEYYSTDIACSELFKIDESGKCSSDQKKYTMTDKTHNHDEIVAADSNEFSHKSSICKNVFRRYFREVDGKTGKFIRKVVILHIIIVVPMVMLTLERVFIFL